MRLLALPLLFAAVHAHNADCERFSGVMDEMARDAYPLDDGNGPAFDLSRCSAAPAEFRAGCARHVRRTGGLGGAVDCSASLHDDERLLFRLAQGDTLVQVDPAWLRKVNDFAASLTGGSDGDGALATKPQMTKQSRYAHAKGFITQLALDDSVQLGEHVDMDADAGTLNGGPDDTNELRQLSYKAHTANNVHEMLLNSLEDPEVCANPQDDVFCATNNILKAQHYMQVMAAKSPLEYVAGGL